ncbi:DUF654-domain-containing protein, partial [Polyplosphaeria fusca]
MSSRALRKAQKELEERQRLEQTQEEEEEESEEELAPASNPKPSLFAMLGEVDEDENNEDDESAQIDAEDEENVEHVAAAAKSSKKSKKKKKKGKGKGKGKAEIHEPEKNSASSNLESGMDEIDRALLALNMTSQAQSGPETEESAPAISEELQQLYTALSINTQHLHVGNEMRKLFGRAALEEGHDDGDAQQGGMAAAVRGRQGTRGGRNLASIGLRRNIFVQGKENWPRATLGGLAMEVVNKRADGIVEYRFVHLVAYQSTQQQFEACVASMNPDQMIRLLQLNPYHISTLLQVSEIFKQQRDNATSGDLLERALFSFGRAVHSTFSTNLAQGKARLDFRRPENREFWLAAWRYIHTLGVRATWRTAFEWAKLMLSMSPEEDPYCMRLLLDQLALRGHDPQGLIDIIQCDHLQRLWKIPPNFAFSTALAHNQLKDPKKARSTLRSAIKEYPWIAARLCKDLDVTPIPKFIWGKEPNTNFQELLCRLYVSSAKDLWNEPETISLLMEVAHSLGDEDAPLGDAEHPYWLAPIDEIQLARHVILTDDRSLLVLIDPHVKARLTSSSDPLPPEDNMMSYSLVAPGVQVQRRDRENMVAELRGLIDYLERLDLDPRLLGGGDVSQEELIRAVVRAGSSEAEFRRNMERARGLRGQLLELGVRV